MTDIGRIKGSSGIPEHIAKLGEQKKPEELKTIKPSAFDPDIQASQKAYLKASEEKSPLTRRNITVNTKPPLDKQVFFPNGQFPPNRING